VDFGHPDKPVVVALATSSRHAKLSVSNSGPALPEGVVGAGLFDSLVSHRPAAVRREAHLGLGLFIVRLVAESHGGRVRAQSVPDRSGARFEVEVLLP